MWYVFSLGILLWKISLDIALQKKKQITQRCGASSLQFVSQLTKALGTISSIKSDIQQIIQKSARAEFGRMHIGGIAMLFNKYLLRPYSVGSTVQCMHFCKLGFHLHWASWCLGPPSATSQRKDFGGRVSGFQSLLWHVLAKQLLYNPQCPYL